MKKLLVIALGFSLFACGNNNEEANREDNTIDEEVQLGAGEVRNPNLELDADSAENFEIDTVNSAEEINQRQQQ